MMGSGDGNLREVIVLEPDEANGQPSCSTVGLAAMMSVPCARRLSLSLLSSASLRHGVSKYPAIVASNQ